MKENTFHLISLGCAKNTVDSTSMGQLLAEAGYRSVDEAHRARVLIVNTCGFIGPAKAESLEMLGELAAHKKPGQLLIAAGCLTQRYGADVVRQVPGIDGILGIAPPYIGPALAHTASAASKMSGSGFRTPTSSLNTRTSKKRPIPRRSWT